jgi:hypothetical protein
MKKYELKIEQDTDPMNPRTDWDNITTIVCFHKRYELGDKTDYRTEDYDSWDELKTQIEKDNKVLLIKPLYMYDHSGITISTSPFGCQWDSGQIGWVFITEKQLNLMCGKDFKRDEETLNCITNSEVKNYDEFLTGNVYQYTIYEIETCDKGHQHKSVVESCGSYYDEGDCKDEGLSVLQHLEENILEQEHKSTMAQDEERYDNKHR